MKPVMKIVLWGVGIITLLVLIFGGLFIYKLRGQLKAGGKIVEWNDSEGTTYTNLRYGEGTRNTFDLIIPTGKHPNSLMLFIHGGAWMGGEKEDMAYETHRYAKQGYATASINYSRLGVDSLDYDSKYDSPCFPSMIDEIYNAVAAIKAKGAELGCDFRQMAIGGYSAGGHLAMLYATQHSEDSPIPLKFQISWVGPADLNTMFPLDSKALADSLNNAEDKAAKENELAEFIRNIIGYKPDMNEFKAEELEKIKALGSPTNYVTENTPAAILIYGAKDTTVSCEQGELMAGRLQEYGIDNELFIFPNSGHLLGDDEDYTTMANNAISRYCETYFD